MARKTEGIYLLVENVLRTFSEPYGEDIILNVCQGIEGNPEWLRRYEELKSQFHFSVVNSWIGQYTKSLTGLRREREVRIKGNPLIKSYSKLVP